MRTRPETETDRLPIGRMARAVAPRPDLWPVAVKAGLSLAPSGWWRRRPFLPIPDSRWLAFRMSTAYGGTGTLDADSPFTDEDLITWLEWRREWPD